MSDTPIDRKAMLKQAHETVARHAMEGRPAPGVTLDGTNIQDAHFERWTQVTLTLACLGDAIDKAERLIVDARAGVDDLPDGDFEATYALIAGLEHAMKYPRPRGPIPPRGNPGCPCEDCGQTDKGSTLDNGWHRCNACGYPSQ